MESSFRGDSVTMCSPATDTRVEEGGSVKLIIPVTGGKSPQDACPMGVGLAACCTPTAANVSALINVGARRPSTANQACVFGFFPAQELTARPFTVARSGDGRAAKELLSNS